MPNPMRDKNEGMCRGGDGKTPVTRIVQKVAGGNPSEELGRTVVKT